MPDLHLGSSGLVSSCQPEWSAVGIWDEPQPIMRRRSEGEKGTIYTLYLKSYNINNIGTAIRADTSIWLNKGLLERETTCGTGQTDEGVSMRPKSTCVGRIASERVALLE